MSAGVDRIKLKEPMWELGTELTEVSSHVDTGHHLDLVRGNNCSDELCIVFDGRRALFPPGKFMYRDIAGQKSLAGVMATSIVTPSEASTTAVFPTI